MLLIDISRLTLIAPVVDQFLNGRVRPTLSTRHCGVDVDIVIAECERVGRASSTAFDLGRQGCGSHKSLINAPAGGDPESRRWLRRINADRRSGC